MDTRTFEHVRKICDPIFRGVGFKKKKQCGRQEDFRSYNNVYYVILSKIREFS